MPLQQGLRSYILLESTCSFFAYCYEFHNRESYNGFVLHVERDFKNLLFGILITEKIFENWSYLSSCSLFKDVCPEEYAKMYYGGRLSFFL